MPLKDIHKKLYDRKSDDLVKRPLAQDAFDPTREEEPVSPPPSNGGGPDVWLSPEEAQGMIVNPIVKAEETRRKYMRYAWTTLGSIVVILMAVLGVIKWQESTFSEERVMMEIKGQTDVKSGQETTYEIFITNSNRVDLNQAVLKLNYSEDFVVEDQPTLLKEGFNGAKIDVGTIKSKEQKRYVIKARTYGPNSKQVYINAVLAYQPSNFNSTFEEKAQLSGIIQSSMLKLTMLASQEAAAGEEVGIQLIIKNDSSEPFTDVDVKMEYPGGFTFKNSDPPVVLDNRMWTIASVGGGEQVKIVVNGSLDGTLDSVKLFKAYVGKGRSDGEFSQFTETEMPVRMISPRLVIDQTVNQKKEFYANAGDQMEFVIRFSNNTNVAVNELVLTDVIASPVLNKTTISVENGGFYDSNTDTITWRGSTVDKLKVLGPGEQGEVKFRAAVLERFPINSEKDKNFVINSQAKVECFDCLTDLPQNKRSFSNNLAIKVNSRLSLDLAGYYNDAELPNSGPIPLRIGEETTFAVRIGLTNTSNNLKNVVLSTSLAPGAKWKDRYIPEEAVGKFNDRTSELTWEIGTLDAGAGILSPVQWFAFQVGIIPSANQVHHSVPLLNQIKVTALDTFTNQPVEYSFTGLTSDDVKDLSHDDSRVVPE